MQIASSQDLDTHKINFNYLKHAIRVLREGRQNQQGAEIFSKLE
jgi:hypothetical protein